MPFLSSLNVSTSYIIVLEKKKSIKIDLDKTMPLTSVNSDDKKPIKDKKNKKTEETEETSFDDIDNLLK